MDHARSRIGAVMALVFTLALVVGACTGGPAATATPGPTIAPTDSPSTAASPLPSPTSRPTAASLPTFAASAQPATVAPAGAITLEMRHEGTTPGFSPNQITAPAGTIVLYLTNTDALRVRHDFNVGQELRAGQARMGSIGGGTAAVFTISDMAPGDYTFWCSINDHFKFGMVGTLTVTP